MPEHQPDYQDLPLTPSASVSLLEAAWMFLWNLQAESVYYLQIHKHIHDGMHWQLKKVYAYTYNEGMTS